MIGAGHGEGIRRKLNEAPADLEELEKIPAKNSLGKWILPMLILGIVVGGFFMGGTDKGVAMIKWWFIITALGAALGSAAALAHPGSILVSPSLRRSRPSTRRSRPAGLPAWPKPICANPRSPTSKTC